MTCRELGFTKSTLVYSGSVNKDSTTWMTNFRCSGNEKSMVLCFHGGWKNHSCKFGQLAGVVCSIPEGRVELLMLLLLFLKKQRHPRIQFNSIQFLVL